MYGDFLFAKKMSVSTQTQDQQETDLGVFRLFGPTATATKQK